MNRCDRNTVSGLELRHQKNSRIGLAGAHFSLLGNAEGQEIFFFVWSGAGSEFLSSILSPELVVLFFVGILIQGLPAIKGTLNTFPSREGTGVGYPFLGGVRGGFFLNPFLPSLNVRVAPTIPHE